MTLLKINIIELWYWDMSSFSLDQIPTWTIKADMLKHVTMIVDVHAILMVFPQIVLQSAGFISYSFRKVH